MQLHCKNKFLKLFYVYSCQCMAVGVRCTGAFSNCKSLINCEKRTKNNKYKS